MFLFSLIFFSISRGTMQITVNGEFFDLWHLHHYSSPAPQARDQFVLRVVRTLLPVFISWEKTYRRMSYFEIEMWMYQISSSVISFTEPVVAFESLSPARSQWFSSLSSRRSTFMVSKWRPQGFALSLGSEWSQVQGCFWEVSSEF